jgi:hypothetical protein
MKGQANTLAFIDLLFNLLLGITFMFIMAFLMINPVADTGEVDPPVRIMVELTWHDKSKVDFDLWVRSHDGTWIGYSNKEGNYMTLERDDLGETSDTYTLNGQAVTVDRNYEVINFSALPQGEYVVNVHYYAGTTGPEEVTVKVTQLSPYKLLHTRTHMLNLREEWTMVSFTVDHEGVVRDIRDDLQIPFRREQQGMTPNDL